VKELDCVSCGHTVPLFSDYRVASGRYGDEKDRDYVICPDCGDVSLAEDWKGLTKCESCDAEWVPQEGTTSRGGYYNCPECGQKESIVDAIAEQGKASHRLYAVEYYCQTCADQGKNKQEFKGYKQVEPEDLRLFEEAKQSWETRTDLHDYIPVETIPEGAITAASEVSGNDVFQHGYERWEDMFNERQLLCLSLLLQCISKIGDDNIREFLLLNFSETLNYNTMMNIYNPNYNKNTNIFKNNSFSPPSEPIENNVWGTEDGTGTFRSMFDMVLRGVEYAGSPTDRYVVEEETVETEGFAIEVGRNSKVSQSDMRQLDAENEYDAVITDPPYYDNIIYSEVADYFYVWQKILLEGEYPGFDQDKTPRAESIVTNPYLNKTAEDFEHEMGEALAVINRALKDNGTLAFTYHHSDEESWGELLESLCNTGFEVTATYPISSDLNKFIGGEAVSFDIVIVARPSDNQTPISWRHLRIDILNRLDRIQDQLEDRDLTEGDIGVIEMGACFAEYSKHHGEVRRGGDIMSAKDAVDEIYGIIQEGALGEQDIFLDLLRTRNPTFNDLNKLLRKSDASEEEFREKALFRMDGNDFHLGDWRDTERQAYVVEKVESGESEPTPLEQAHFLRYRYEEGKSTGEYREQWEDEDLTELCESLAEITRDETYLKMLGADYDLSEFED
jgi:putative DNA methylase